MLEAVVIVLLSVGIPLCWLYVQEINRESLSMHERIQHIQKLSELIMQEAEIKRLDTPPNRGSSVIPPYHAERDGVHGNCRNCGAPLHSNRCEYCGTVFYS